MHICSLWNYLHNPSSLDYQVIYSLSTQNQSTMGDSIDVQVGFVQFSWHWSKLQRYKLAGL